MERTEISFAQKEAIRQNWRLRNILRAIQNRLPEGYVVTNKKPVQKEMRRIDSSSTATYWSSWVKNGNETFLAVLDGEKVKLFNQNELTQYKLRSVA